MTLAVEGLLQTVTTVRAGRAVEYRVSHGLCPACEAAHLLEILRARASKGRSHAEGEVAHGP